MKLLVVLAEQQLRIQGGGQGGHGPPVPVIKKMAATGGPLYFMFLGPPPLTILDPILNSP